MTSSEPETTSSPVKVIKSDKDGPLLTKRKSEVATLDKANSVDETNDTNKKRNLGVSSVGESDASDPIDDERNGIVVAENGDQEDEVQEAVHSEDDVDEEDFEGGDFEDDDDDEDEEDEDGHVNGALSPVDRKGKGIMKDEKGKGKLIEESEDDSSSCATESDDDSDLSDDPLAEVDLDNILPTRTRRRTVQPGINISKAPGNQGGSG